MIAHKLLMCTMEKIKFNVCSLLVPISFLSHYTIFAVPTVKKENDPQGAPFTPVIPLNLLISSAVTSELVDETTDPVPFIVGSYKSNKLPKHITFDGKAMKKSFKPKTHYSIVVAAFSSTKVLL